MGFKGWLTGFRLSSKHTESPPVGTSRRHSGGDQALVVDCPEAYGSLWGRHRPSGDGRPPPVFGFAARFCEPRQRLRIPPTNVAVHRCARPAIPVGTPTLVGHSTVRFAPRHVALGR